MPTTGTEKPVSSGLRNHQFEAVASRAVRATNLVSARSEAGHDRILLSGQAVIPWHIWVGNKHTSHPLPGHFRHPDLGRAEFKFESDTIPSMPNPGKLSREPSSQPEILKGWRHPPALVPRWASEEMPHSCERKIRHYDTRGVEYVAWQGIRETRACRNWRNR